MSAWVSQGAFNSSKVQLERLVNLTNPLSMLFQFQ